MIKARIAELASEHGLTRLATFTLDPQRLPHGARSDRYLRNNWRKMRVKLERKFGGALKFIAFLEFQKSGLAHLHVLFGIFIPQAWLSEAWQAVGGGKIVDIRYIEIQRVAGYLTTYLAGKKIAHTLSLLPLRARIFTTSRGLRLSGRPKASGWWLRRRHIKYLRSHSSDVTKERYQVLDPDSPPVLTNYESTIGQEDIGDRSLAEISQRIVAVQENQDAS
jgi:hypothetical protein